MPPIIVSPQGLARCPKCDSHVKIEAADSPSCPFCGADFVSGGEGGRRLGKGTAVLAAALLGSQLACGSELATPVYGAPAPPDSGSDVSEDTADAADAEDVSTRDVAPDVTSDAPDGSADVVFETGDADVPPAPPYGIPPDPDEP